MKHTLKIVTFVLGTLVLLASCKTSRVATQPADATKFVSSRLQLTVPNKNSTVTLNGTMKLVSHERMQLSVLMPILRSEVLRIDLTPDEVIVVDRMNKQYVRATREELKEHLPKKAEFSQLEKLVFGVAAKEERVTVTAAELGIPSMDKAKVEFYDFSHNEFTLTPTDISNKYTEISVDKLLDMLDKL